MNEDEVDALYGLDPEDFIPARDELVRALRKSDDLAGAAAVAKLRKPTVAAWALNRLVRDQASEVEDLLATGAALRQAQEAALRGGGASELRTATEARRRAVGALVRHAKDLLVEGGRGDTHLGAVSATLEAATVDDALAAQLRAGRLDKEQSAAGVGFGFGDLGDWSPPAKTVPKESGKAKKGGKDKPSADKPERAAKDAPAKPDRELERLSRQLDDAVAEAESRRATAAVAEERVRELKADLADATKDARSARTEATRAELYADQLRQRAWEAGERSRRP